MLELSFSNSEEDVKCDNPSKSFKSQTLFRKVIQRASRNTSESISTSPRTGHTYQELTNAIPSPPPRHQHMSLDKAVSCSDMHLSKYPP